MVEEICGGAPPRGSLRPRRDTGSERLGLALPGPLRFGVAQLLRAAGDPLVDPATLVGTERAVAVVQDAARQLQAVAPFAARQMNVGVAVPDAKLIAQPDPLGR